MKEPPWIQKSTGSDAFSSVGVQTLRFRQSSPCGTPFGRLARVERAFVGLRGDLPEARRIAHAVPAPASRPADETASLPTGGSAYGMPRNTATSLSQRPRTAP